jgi:hypothetical protein
MRAALSKASRAPSDADAIKLERRLGNIEGKLGTPKIISTIS